MYLCVLLTFLLFSASPLTFFVLTSLEPSSSSSQVSITFSSSFLLFLFPGGPWHPLIMMVLINSLFSGVSEWQYSRGIAERYVLTWMDRQLLVGGSQHRSTCGPTHTYMLLPATEGQRYTSTVGNTSLICLPATHHN